jgi:hypothetical protein
MNGNAVLKLIDALVFQRTGKHLKSLQAAILQGVLSGQKYGEIAAEYGCTIGHVKDEGYELWKILSEVLGEELNKSNFRATVERLGFVNLQPPMMGNSVEIDCLHLFINSTIIESNDLVEIDIESDRKVLTYSERSIEAILDTIRVKMVQKLIQLGLTGEQIDEVVNFSLHGVQAAMEIEKH